MALGRPILDNASYEQLRDELVQRIPVYNPEWTDHNPSDPGITLLELFAFLGENLLFRFNQLPETAYLEFLRLLDVPLRPAVPARALLRFTTDVVDGSLVPLVPMGTEARAGSLPFEVQTETRVLPLEAAAVAKAVAPPPDPASEPEVHEFFLARLDALGGLATDEEAAPYRPERVPDAPGAPPVDFDATVDGILWVALLAPADQDPAALRAALLGHAQAPFELNLGFVPDLAAPAVPQTCPGEGVDAGGPAVEWEVSTGLIGPGERRYRRLTVTADTTRGLTREGIVRLRLPRNGEAAAFDIDDPDLAGGGDLPPELDEESTARTLLWLRAFRPDGSRFGKVAWVGANAAHAEQVRRARTEFLGTGNAQPGQAARLIHRPVVAGSATIEVEEATGWVPWQEVDGFHASGPEDRHYVLDPEAGIVRFGNGLQGRAPQIGERLRARGYRSGGGRAGNVAGGAISKLVPSGPGAAELARVKVDNPLPAWGGADGEALAAALERIPGELRRRDRAVTRGDFRELALAVSGVGRAECLPRFHPATRRTDAAGVVTVVAWPAEDPAHPDAPVPDRRLLSEVCRFLDARRLVTTELYVIPPRYRKVAVAVGLQTKPGYGAEAVRRWVEQVLRQYLAALPPYGPEGTGWPLGRRVYGPELEAAALQVEGVEYLEGLRLAGWSETGNTWLEGTVQLDLDELPELAEITVAQGVPAAPGEALGPVPPERTPVPVPVLREEC